MTNEEALWRACLDDPEEDTARGALADKLQEAGFDTLAQVMRGELGKYLAGAAAGGETVWRLMLLPAERRHSEIRDLIHDMMSDLCNSNETVTGLMANTDLGLWGIDDYVVESTQLTDDGLLATLWFTVSSNTTGNSWGHGDTIDGSAEVIIGRFNEMDLTVTEAHFRGEPGDEDEGEDDE